MRRVEGRQNWRERVCWKSGGGRTRLYLAEGRAGRLKSPQPHTLAGGERAAKPHGVIHGHHVNSDEKRDAFHSS
jgi:hypothetical protein